MRFLTLLFFLVFTNLHIYSQVRVKSAEDSVGISDAELNIPGNNRTYISDESGLIIVLNKNDSIKNAKISHPGFEDYIGAVKSSSVIYLKPRVNDFGTFIFTAALHDRKLKKDDISNLRVIKSDEINITASQNLADILRYQPNIILNHDPALGTSVSMNGMSGQNVKILRNGAMVSGAMNGSVDISQLNVTNAEQIEIIEGPMSLLYGSNALAGTINIISKIPVNPKILNLKTFTESSGIYNFSASSGKKIGRSGVLISLGRNFFDGWSPGNAWYNPANKTADSSRFSLWKPRQQLMGDISFRIPLGKKSELKFNSDFLNEKIINKGLPQAPYFESAFDDYYTTIRNINTLEINLGKNKIQHNIFVSAGYYKRLKNTYIKDLTSTGIGILTESSGQDTTKIYNQQLRYIAGYKFRKIKFDGGIDATHETFQGKRVLNNSRGIFSASAVVISTLDIHKKHDFRFGIRQTIHSLNKIPLIPSFQYRYKPWQTSSVKLSVSRGFRSPGIKELFLYFVDINHNIKGNESLQSESSWNGDVSINHHKKVKKTHFITLNLSVYYNSVVNLITLATLNTSEYTYVNIGKFKNKGLLSDIKYENNRLEISYKTALVSVANTIDGNGSSFFTSINQSLTCRSRLLKSKKLFVNLFVNRIGKSSTLIYNNTDVVQGYTDPYTMIDCSFSFKSILWKKHINLVLGAKNLNNISNIRSGIGNGTTHNNSSGQRIISTGRTIFLSFELTL